MFRVFTKQKNIYHNSFEIPRLARNDRVCRGMRGGWKCWLCQHFHPLYLIKWLRHSERSEESVRCNCNARLGV